MKQQTYLISDLHLGHENILNFRTQFSTIDEHDDFIVKTILKMVKPNDNLILLGDLCFKKEKFHLIKLIVGSVLNCKIILGNHDLERSYAPNIYDFVSLGAKILGSHSTYKNVILSHAPIHPNELRGNPNIHGHTHSANINDARYLNVSCENLNYIPISFGDCLSILNQSMS